MARFFFRHFPLGRFQIKSRRLRALRIRLARKRSINRELRSSLEALEIAAGEIQVQNWRIMEENELMFLANTLVDQWVCYRLIELENDPLMRNAFERTSARNLDRRNIINGQRPRSTFPGRRRRRR